MAEHALHELHVSAYGHSADNPGGLSRGSSGIRNCELGGVSTGDKQLVIALLQDSANWFYALSHNVVGTRQGSAEPGSGRRFIGRRRFGAQKARYHQLAAPSSVCPATGYAAFNSVRDIHATRLHVGICGRNPR